jgi:alkylhydroperoxidase family enzyme
MTADDRDRRGEPSPADPEEEARLPRLAPDQVSGATRAIFEAFQRQRGNVPNLFRVAAHRPAIVETLHAHMQAVLGPGEVSVLLKELLAVRVSQINGCRY